MCMHPCPGLNRCTCDPNRITEFKHMLTCSNRLQRNFMTEGNIIKQFKRLAAFKRKLLTLRKGAKGNDDTILLMKLYPFIHPLYSSHRMRIAVSWSAICG